MVGALLLVEPASPWQWVVLGGCLALSVYHLVKDRAHPVRDFAMRDGQWYLQIAGESAPVSLYASHFLLPNLGVMRFRTASGDVVSIAIMPDSLSREDCRRLALALA
jgi:hypothetical protein